MAGVENQILMYALGFHAGMILVKFFDALTRDLVLPMLSPLASAEGGISKLIIQVGSVKLNIGDVIVQTLNMMLAFAIIYITLPYIKEYVPIAGRR